MKKLYHKKLVTLVWTLWLLLISALPAQAVDGIKAEGGSSIETLSQFLDRFINVFLLGFVGIGSFAAFVIAGFMYLMSGANTEKTGKAKKTMFYAVLGLILAALSYGLFKIAINILNNVFK